MARNPRPHRPGAGDQLASRILGDPPPAQRYGPPAAGRVVPDRSRPPVIGPACPEALGSRSGAPRVDPETNAGPELGTRGNNGAPKTAQEYGDSVRESRGVRTRP
jgi:hypothetical protein